MSAIISLVRTCRISSGTIIKRWYAGLSGKISPCSKIVCSSLPDKIIPDISLMRFIFDQFDGFKNQIALVDGISGYEVSYAQFRDDCARLSSGLRRIGLQKNDVLAICAPNSIEYPHILFATMAAGGVVSTCNPMYTSLELNYQFSNSRARYVVTIPSILSTVQEAIIHTSVEKIIVVSEIKQKNTVGNVLFSLQSLSEDSGSLFEIENVSSNEDIAVLPYSSGTTGLPKGVMLTHHNLVSNCCQLDHPNAQGLVNGETILSILHISGMALILFQGLYKGTKQIILPKFEPHLFLSSIEKYRVHSANLVPPLILFLSKHEDVTKYDLTSLNNVTSGAAPLGSEVLIQNACSRTGIQIIRQSYGLTETSPVTHMKPLQMGMQKPRSIGPPLPNQNCKVVNPESGIICDANEQGEIVISGPNVMKGYLNKPDDTMKCIDNNGWFYTGDIGYYDHDGHFYITDRLKDLIKVKGYQVPPAELEALLLHHPSILDVAVVGVPHERFGEAPKAFVVRNTDYLTETDVVQYVKDNISEHKWLSGGVEFMESIPKSASGKILRRNLRN